MSDEHAQSPRAKLALAIENYRAQAKHVAELEAAKDRALDQRLEARRRRDDAQAALDHAQRDEAERLVTALLDVSVTTASPVTERAAALSRAEEQYEQAVRASVAIEDRLEQSLRDLRWSTVMLDEAVAVVAAHSPAVESLITELRDARRRAFGLGAALDLLRSKNALTSEQRQAAAVPEADPEPLALWQAALTALAANAGAPLPGEDQ